MADALGDYRAKRDFAATPEPAGGRFVVQEHHARRLHWDLRLERDGVAVSWAVPKGIPEDPARNHLAVHVEDHPIEYLEFAGQIPAGHYGAGEVKIWDKGTYVAEKFRENEVIATFHGERMRGRYALFQTRGNDWMIHRMDPPVDPGREPLPDRLRPMLARLGELPPDEERWAYEVKWDGVRALVYVEGGTVRLVSRTGREMTAQYPELRGLGRALGTRPALLDGEIVALDERGRPSFEALQGRIHLAGETAVRRAVTARPVTLMLFDVLHLDGRSLMPRPWTERRTALEELGLESERWRTPAARRGEGAAFLAATKAQELEGIVAKRLDSPYEPGRRGGAWLKIKNHGRQEFVIAGWLPGEGRRRDRIGALLLGYYEDGELRYAGRVGTGFKEADLDRLRELLAPLERAESPFADAPRLPREAVFAAPVVVAEVEFAEWTSAGVLRAPSFKGLRSDKPATEVVREGREPEEPAAAPEPRPPEPPPPPSPERPPDPPARAAAGPAAKAGELEVDGRRIRVSNLDKVLYPETGFTKAQVIDYFIRVGPVWLPHLRGRPLTLHRFPNGVEAKSFYEKNCPSHRPEWVNVAPLPADKGRKEINYCLADDLPTLVWMANLAALELHSSLARAERIEEPTLLVFDLDPGPPADVIDCAQVALWVRAVCAEHGLSGVVKTSGSKGLQVYFPLAPGHDYERTRVFAKALAERLAGEHPDRVVSRMAKAQRGGKVFIDWSQNHRSKTTVAVYSLRARPRPTASTPVAWEEIEGALAAADPALLTFEAGQVLERVAEHGDLFAPALESDQELPALEA